WVQGDIWLKGNATIVNRTTFFASPLAGTVQRTAADTNVSVLNTGNVYATVFANPVIFNVPFKNQGTLRVQGGGTLALNDGGENAGTIEFSTVLLGGVPTGFSTLQLGATQFGGVYNRPEFKWKGGAIQGLVGTTIGGTFSLKGPATDGYPILVLEAGLTLP